MSRRQVLLDLCAALRGSPRPDTDWMATVALANQALVTPTLAEALKDAAIPEDLHAFLTEIAARNHERNRRLRDMAIEAAAALNAAGIVPTVLKGTAIWETSRPGQPFARLMNDIDFLVRPEEAPAAIQTLRAGGFDQVSAYDGPVVHVVAEFARPTDVGLIDLHQRPPGPPGMAEQGRVADQLVWDGLARAPSPARQIFLICLHDQLHDGDFWRGGFDLRHLLDMAELTRAGVDWGELDALLTTRLTRNAVHAELIAAHELVGAAIPRAITSRLPARLHHRRHMAQHLHSRWNWALGMAGFCLEVANIAPHGTADKQSRNALLGSASVDQRDHRNRAARMKKIMARSVGKI